MGNAGGFLTIHTQPFTTEEENILVITARWVENMILQRISNTKNKFLPFEKLKKVGNFEEFIQKSEGEII